MASVFGDGARRPDLVDKTVGIAVGVLLSLVGTSVLGQYEPITGRLLLNAPSVETTRASLGADTEDFALWVCLHEQTHRHQFVAAPWLRGYLLGLMRRISPGGGDTASRGGTGQDGRAAISQGGRVAARRPQTSGLGLVGTLGLSQAGPLIDEVTAVMSLMEGYADMLMDTAGAVAIPTLPAIRRSFDERRRRPNHSLANLVRRAFGFTAKIDQYVVGKVFCETVRRQVGIDGLNTAFLQRDALPTIGELHDPKSWVARRFGAATTRTGGGVEASPDDAGATSTGVAEESAGVAEWSAGVER
jgi:coenzyme F420 biosynthesis associated uncharacterized protein